MLRFSRLCPRRLWRQSVEHAAKLSSHYTNAKRSSWLHFAAESFGWLLISLQKCGIRRKVAAKLMAERNAAREELEDWDCFWQSRQV